MKDKIRTEQEVLIEGKSLDKKYYIGRTKSDVPDIDGVIYIKDKKIEMNSFIKCRVTDYKDYDLVGVLKK